MLSEAQKGVLKCFLTRVESQLGPGYKTTLEQLIDAPLDPVDANHLVGLTLELGKPLSFNARVEAVKELQAEINSYHFCHGCKKYINRDKPTGGFCQECDQNMNQGYRSFDDLKNAYTLK